MNLSVVILLSMLSMLPGRANDLDDDPLICRCSWTAPVDGGPVEYYLLQLRYLDEDSFFTIAATPDTTVQVPVLPLKPVEARVCGINHHPITGEERQGPWSDTSDVFINDWGLPSSPSTPRRQR